jgi:hypothetical protein
MLPPAYATKMLFQSLSRQLNKSAVMGILAKRKSTCAYPAGLMKGTMALNAKYITMWKRDRCVDYLLEASEIQSNTNNVANAGETLHSSDELVDETLEHGSSGNVGGRSVGSARSSNNFEDEIPGTTMRRTSNEQLGVLTPGSSALPPPGFSHTPQSGRSLLARLLRGQQRNNKNHQMLQSGETVRTEQNGSGRSHARANSGSNTSSGRDRSGSTGSLTPRIMTPQVWGGSGETRSPSFRPNMLISKPDGGSIHQHQQGSAARNISVSPPIPSNSHYSSSISSNTATSASAAAASTIEHQPLAPSPATFSSIGELATKQQQRQRQQLQRQKEQNHRYQHADSKTPAAPASNRNSASATTPQKAAATPLSNTTSTTSSSASQRGAQSSFLPSSKEKNTSEEKNNEMGLSIIHSMNISIEEQEKIDEAREEEFAKLELLKIEKAEKEEKQKIKRAKERVKKIQRRLTKGHLFYKHGRNNKAERRFVYVDQQLTTIAWRKPAKNNTNKPTKAFPITDVLDVVPNLIESGARPVQSNNYCFTLQLKTRSIQLECDNERHRDAWLEGKVKYIFGNYYCL